MTLKEFLLSKPDSAKFDLSYVFECRCARCGKYFDEEDEEYSNFQTVGEFRHEVISGESDTHYHGYDWIYEDYYVDDCGVVKIREEGDNIFIIIKALTVGDDYCEECRF